MRENHDDFAMAGQQASEAGKIEIRAGAGFILTARVRMVLMASQSVSVYPMIANVLK